MNSGWLSRTTLTIVMLTMTFAPSLLAQDPQTADPGGWTNDP